MKKLVDWKMARSQIFFPVENRRPASFEQTLCNVLFSNVIDRDRDRLYNVLNINSFNGITKVNQVGEEFRYDVYKMDVLVPILKIAHLPLLQLFQFRTFVSTEWMQQ